MRKQEIFLSLVFPTLFLTLAGRLWAQDQGLRWLDNYRDAVQEAKRTQKPIFLEFRCEP